MELFNWHGTEVLITGGTGSLGKTITKLLMEKYKPRGIRIYSRDEFKQWEMQKWVKLPKHFKNLLRML